MSISRALLVSGLLAFSGSTAMAEDVPACASFAWSVARERTAFAAPDLPTVTSGSALSGGTGAARLVLKPIADVTLLFPSEKALKPGTFAGSVTATIPAAGTYQVTLSDDAWIDVSQDGRTSLRPSAHSGKAACPDVRKSLRFVLDAGAVTIEVSRAPAPDIKLDLLEAE
ncbi:hypothetical protein ACFZ8E_02815 [Methylobacterium sp. HMF5984]|uniref:hypothetical protein n=1 Tax=Methylobacterium sp. HMF5984 TaxID=3367370 RepID=UPI003852B813